jgi:predicted ATPase
MRHEGDKSLGLRIEVAGGRNRDVTEVGFGVSQVVPVLLAGLLQSRKSPFIVDLPEAHLHPRSQALLADFFCSICINGTTSIVETHSEAFFHQLRLRVAENPALASMIGIYFVDAATAEGCSVPRLIGLEERDEIIWPEGFLNDSWEREIRIQELRENRAKSTA